MTTASQRLFIGPLSQAPSRARGVRVPVAVDLDDRTQRVHVRGRGDRLGPQRGERLAALQNGRLVIVREAAWLLIRHADGARGADERLGAVNRRVAQGEVLEAWQLAGGLGLRYLSEGRIAGRLLGWLLILAEVLDRAFRELLYHARHDPRRCAVARLRRPWSDDRHVGSERLSPGRLAAAAPGTAPRGRDHRRQCACAPRRQGPPARLIAPIEHMCSFDAPLVWIMPGAYRRAASATRRTSARR